MKLLRWAPVLAALILVISGCAATNESYAPSTPRYVTDESYFYDGLSPYGSWFDYSSYGWCWMPSNVSYGWRPYWDGSWVYTDYGWTWDTPEPWGWATYHYGRWIDDPSYGWVWVPDTEWAPAWVAWREGGDWVGWSPLPPGTAWDPSSGLRSAGSTQIPARDWSFVKRDQLTNPHLRTIVEPIARNVTLIPQTDDATRFLSLHGHPLNRGIDPVVIDQTTGHRVPRLKILASDTPVQKGRGAGGIRMFMPTLRPSTVPPPPRARIQPRAVVPTPMQRARHDAARRNLDAYLQAQRQRLDREQQAEMHSAMRSANEQEISRRHQAERQALDAEAQREQRLLDQRDQGSQDQQQAAPPDRRIEHTTAERGHRGHGRGRGNHD